MPLVDLIVTVCLIAHPGACEKRHMLFEAKGSLRTCMYEAQFYLAKWSSEHPQYDIKRWQCAWPNSEGSDT
jgi:hypothetical protein